VGGLRKVWQKGDIARTHIRRTREIVGRSPSPRGSKIENQEGGGLRPSGTGLGKVNDLFRSTRRRKRKGKKNRRGKGGKRPTS